MIPIRAPTHSTLKVFSRMLSRNLSRQFSSFSRHEIRAWNSLLKRSGIKTHKDFARLLPTISSSNTISRKFCTSQSNPQNEQGKPDPGDEEHQRRLRRFAVVSLAFFLLANLLLSAPNGDPNNQPRGNQQNQSGSSQRGENTLTWNDFYYNMLQAGEVESIDIYPNANVLFVKLKQGALYKVRTSLKIS